MTFLILCCLWLMPIFCVQQGTRKDLQAEFERG